MIWKTNKQTDDGTNKQTAKWNLKKELVLFLSLCRPLQSATITSTGEVRFFTDGDTSLETPTSRLHVSTSPQPTTHQPTSPQQRVTKPQSTSPQPTTHQPTSPQQMATSIQGKHNHSYRFIDYGTASLAIIVNFTSALIGQAVSEKKVFEIVDDDGRTPEHGYTISSLVSLRLR